MPSFVIKYYAGQSPEEARLEVTDAELVGVVDGGCGFVFKLPEPVRISYSDGPELVDRLALFPGGKLAAVTSAGIYHWTKHAPLFEYI